MKELAVSGSMFMVIKRRERGHFGFQERVKISCRNWGQERMKNIARVEIQNYFKLIGTK
jgi:hypothetical protein